MSWKKTALAAGVALSATAGLARAEGQLNIYNWGNYTSPELIKKFETEHNVKVTVTDYDSNDTALAKVRAGGSGFDIVVPSANFIPIWVKEGLLLESRPDQMENFKNIDERWVDVPWDPGRRYSVPWQWGTGGVMVNTNVYAGDPNTSAIFLDPPAELIGKVNVAPEMSDVMYTTIRYMGGEWCSDDKDMLKKVRDKLKEAKAKWIAMDYEVPEKMGKGDYSASFFYNGAGYRTRLENPAVHWGFPKEGYHLFMDSAAITADAPNVENAKLFMNFIMAPENAALISNFATYANGIKGSGAFMNKGIAEAPELNIPAELVSAGGWQDTCSPEVYDLYTRIWTDLLKE